MIRGSDPALKNEYVLVDGHYDHLGIGRPVNGDSIYNGADDDASGVTAVLEIARQMMKGPKPKRTVVFAAMMGEEVGLLGTNWYIAHPAIPLEQDGGESRDRDDRPARFARGRRRPRVAHRLRALEHGRRSSPRTGSRSCRTSGPTRTSSSAATTSRSRRRGIPAHTLSSFNLHADYHQPSDDITKVDFVHMAGVINAGAKAVRILTDGPKPEWKAGGKP